MNVPDAQPSAADLVGIGRTNALPCRPDLGTALGCLLCCIDHAVRGEDQVRLARDDEALTQIVPAAGECASFFGKEDGVKDHTITDDVDLVALEDT